jgi:hypothetical protein
MLLQKLQKLTMEIIFLCEEQKRSRYMKHKKINYLVNLMKSDMRGNVKMTVEEQIQKTLEKRKNLMQIYSLLKFETQKPLKDNLNLSTNP